MPDIARVIQTEIARTARKEITAVLKSIRADFVKQVKELKKQIKSLSLGKMNERATAKKGKRGRPKKVTKKRAVTKRKVAKKQTIKKTAGRKPGFTAKGIKTLRIKLGLSQGDFAKLIGISGQAVYIMEHKTGKLNLRKNTASKLAEIKGIGKKEAAKRLEKIK